MRFRFNCGGTFFAYHSACALAWEGSADMAARGWVLDEIDPGDCAHVASAHNVICQILL